MEQLNGQPLSYYGLIPIGYEGILDMPSRLGDAFYDWGDYMQPLVEDQDIFWQERDFSLKAVFDQRITVRTLEGVVNELAKLPECLLESKYGDFTVRVKQVLNVRAYENVTTLRVVFSERLPQLGAVLPLPIGGTGLLIDDYDLKNDFGIVLKSVKERHHIPPAKPLSDTVFNTSPILSRYRDFRTIELDCALPYDHVSDLVLFLGRFKTVLSQSGYRAVSYQGEHYHCFLNQGFKVIFSGEGIVTFKVRLHFIQNGFTLDSTVITFDSIERSFDEQITI